MKEELKDRGLFTDAPMLTDKESVDLMMAAMIEACFVKAATSLQEENEDRLSLSDNAKLTINKPATGRITVDSSAFSIYDGHVVIKRGQEMVIRDRDGQILITLRQG